MKIYLQVEGNRVMGYGLTRSNETDIEMDVPDNHEVLNNPFVFTYENGQLVKDEAYQQQLIQEKEALLNKPSTEDQLTLIQKAIDDIILGVM